MPSVSVHQKVKGYLFKQFLVIVLHYTVSIAYPVQTNELSDLVQSFPGRVDLPVVQKSPCFAVIRVNFVFALSLPWPVSQ